MFDMLISNYDNVIKAIKADYELTLAIKMEALTQAQTRLLNAKTEHEVARIQNTLMTTLSSAIDTNPALRERIVTIMVLNGLVPGLPGLSGLSGLAASPSRQIVSSVSNNPTDDWG